MAHTVYGRLAYLPGTQLVVGNGVYPVNHNSTERRMLRFTREIWFTGMIGFDTVRDSKRSGSRMQGCLVNAPCTSIGANTKRADFALAA